LNILLLGVEKDSFFAITFYVYFIKTSRPTGKYTLL